MVAPPTYFPSHVLYDHDDKCMPHIVFFASEDIPPPPKDLSYDYKYVLDAVHDSEGNIKKKRCFCGSVECTGWLY
jgi:SET domain-containing protein